MEKGKSYGNNDINLKKWNRVQAKEQRRFRINAGGKGPHGSDRVLRKTVPFPMQFYLFQFKIMLIFHCCFALQYTIFSFGMSTEKKYQSFGPLQSREREREI